MHTIPLRLMSAAITLAIAPSSSALTQQLREGIAIGDDWLVWRHDAAVLHLVAAAHGITVVRAEPNAPLGLQHGDQIDSVGQPLHTPEQLLAALRAAHGQAITLGVEHAGSMRNIVLAARDDASLLPPAPPARPAPPAPPSPVQVR